MKIAVSNIAWEKKDLEEHLALLRDLGCDGVEIAPSCVWEEPIRATDKEIDLFKKMIERFNLAIPAFHALLYTRPDLYLFGSRAKRQDTIDYLKDMMRLAGRLSARALIYGSPRSRAIGKSSLEDCYKIAVDVFSELAQEAARYDTSICIEPLGPSESEFINTADEGFRLVTDVGHPHFGLHLDAKAMIETSEDFEKVFDKYGSIMRHFHVADPNLAPPGHTGMDHSKIGNSLSRSGYKGYVSIEMRRGFGNSKEVVEKAVKYVREKYNIARDPA